MSDILNRYKQLDYKLSEVNLAWRMYESGVENFGKAGKPDALQVPEPKADEVLLRVDTIGICFSDVKLITQGSSHPRIKDRDLQNDPVIAGHEVSLTVVKAGDNYKNTYKPGDRFIVQADVYYKGVGIAYGYALPGGMEQFCIVGEPVLNGDEGSYLIPVKPDTGYAEAALVEPWTCVVASYRIYPRKAIQAGGVTLIASIDDRVYEFDSALFAEGFPAKVILAGLTETQVAAVRAQTGNAEIVETGKVDVKNLKALVQERTGEKGFNDVIILGTPDADLAEELGQYLAKSAIMAIVADKPIDRKLQIDVGRVHYDYLDYVGTKSTKVSAAYANSRDSEFKENGTAWFIGAAGPMGQMHVQRAALLKNGPKKILCTDVDNNRLDYLKASVRQSVEKNGIEMIFLNPMEVGNEVVEKAIADLTGGKGFDDIVVLAPVAALISGSVGHIGENGLMNIFAGVPIGTIASIDLSVTYMNSGRFVGSSGSRPKDMVDTLAFTEAGELPTRNSLAAIGGINAMVDGVCAVKTAKFPGKTVIFPHIELPLTALEDLKDVLPNVFAKLVDGKFWTQEAEDELLKTKLKLD